MNSNMNQIEEKSQEINRLEDELSQYRFGFKDFDSKDFDSVDETNDDCVGWGTIILAIIAGWMFGD